MSDYLYLNGKKLPIIEVDYQDSSDEYATYIVYVDKAADDAAWAEDYDLEEQAYARNAQPDGDDAA